MVQESCQPKTAERLRSSKASQQKSYDVLIAGSGPIGATYARYILDCHPTARIGMIDIGRKESFKTGEHLKNAMRFQCDNKTFEYVIKSALQPVSVPSEWHSERSWWNPDQDPETNLPGTGVTRVVGGMATHWTCICPRPSQEEREQSPLSSDELDKLLEEAEDVLGVNSHEFDQGVLQKIIMRKLKNDPGMHGREVKSLPLAAKRFGGDTTDSGYTIWTGVDTILQNREKECSDRFELLEEHQLTEIYRDGSRVDSVDVKDLKKNEVVGIKAKHFVLACGAIENTRILMESLFTNELKAIGRYLTEQAVGFAQISLKGQSRSIPYNDLDPQVFIPYSTNFPHHCQIRRDSFPYDDESTTEDPRFLVDLTFYSKSDTKWDNCVTFDIFDHFNTDVTGMKQATFDVTPSDEDKARTKFMLEDLARVAKILQPDFSESQVKLLDFGTALHITGTTRMGNDTKNSVVDKDCKLHGVANLWVGGNGCIPDSTACNPTLTSVAYAIRSAKALAKALHDDKGVIVT